MSRRIAIVAATIKEIEPLFDFLNKESREHSFQSFKYHSTQIDVIISGIGMMQTTFTLMDYLSHHHPDSWLQAGIGGAFDPSLSIGEVYAIESEFVSEFGAEDLDGRMMDPFELGWAAPDRFPYDDGRMLCQHISEKIKLTRATGMTTHQSHGFPEHIERIRADKTGQIESMEGAAFFYVSLMKKIPFLSIRSISNYVEARDVKKWNFPLSIGNLNKAVIKIMEGNLI